MQKSQNKAFTLIELLVVVAIIALLIAILLPSLGRAKANAVRVKCEAQLKQWGTVIAMYEAENIDWFGLEWTEADGTTKHFWNTGAVGTPALYDTEWGHIDTTSANHTNMSTYAITMRVCPGDPLFGQYQAGGAGASAQANRVPVDYAMIRYVPVTANVTMWKTTQFTHPSSTILLLDSPSMYPASDTSTMSKFYAVSDLADLSGEPITAPVPYSTVIQQRHQGIGNVMFMDGHVEQHVKATDPVGAATPFGNDDYFKNIPQVIGPTGLPLAASDKSKFWTTIATP